MQKIVSNIILLGLIIGFGINLQSQNINESFDQIEGRDWYKTNHIKYFSIPNAISELPTLLGLAQGHAFTPYQTKTDDLGQTHIRLKHKYDGIIVDGSEMIIHAENGKVNLINGNIFRFHSSNTNPVIDKKQAVEIGKDALKATKYLWEDEGAEAIIKDIQQNPNATFAPKPELRIWMDVQNQTPVLTYAYDLHTAIPQGKEYIYVDAVSGDLVFRYNDLHTKDVPAMAITKYRDTQMIYTDSVNAAQYRLRETTTGGGIETYNMLSQTDYANAVDFTDADNFWNNVNAAQDEAATDAHWGAKMTYDYFFQKHNFNSYDDLGSKIISYVHYDNALNNASWNGQFMSYGDGNGSTRTAYTCIDICGHELTHGVIDFTANLVYQNEPGALNESFSDIFGMAIKYYADSANFNWKLGDDMTSNGNGIRHMHNPKALGQPDTYLGGSWATGPGDNGGVHTNSGVQNHWFYLLSDGGSGTNDNLDNYNVTGLGIDTAAKIAFRNLSVYLTVNSQYIDARIGAIQSAKDLYGNCSTEMLETANAWYAVGVGAPIMDYDLAVEEIYSPYDKCGLGATEAVSILIRYNGCTQDILAGDTLNISFAVDGGTITTEQLILGTTLSGGDSVIYTFTGTANLASYGNHDLKAWVKYKLDSLPENDSSTVSVVTRTQQNEDFGVTAFLGPIDGCGLGNETVSMEIGFYGCDSIINGTVVPVGYTFNGGAPVIENAIIPTTLYNGDVFTYSFTKKVDVSVPGRYSIDLAVNFPNDSFTADNALLGNSVLHPYSLKRMVMRTFENPNNAVDSFYVVRNSHSYAEISEEANLTGIRGFHMSGGNLFGGGSGFTFPQTDSVWDRNENFSSELCFCADATDMPTRVFAIFQRKQTITDGWYNFLNYDVFEASALRLKVDGVESSETFHPQSQQSDNVEIETVDISAGKGKSFELCFESRSIVRAADPQPNPNGDNVYLDNIYLSQFWPVGLEELNTSGIGIFPNPASSQFEYMIKDAQVSDKLLEIRNLNGSLVLSKQIGSQNSGRVDISKLDAGMYLLEIKSEDNTWMSKVIKTN